MMFAKRLKTAVFGLLLILLASWAITPTSAPVRAETTAGPIITVDTPADLSNSTNFDNHPCNYTSGAIYTPAPDGKCPLRRALLEA
ncbi:MAG: hypothetical protein DWQ04_28465, partial [Chloroflexi bacterium]